MPAHDTAQTGAKPSVCFVAPSAPMVRVLLDTGPAEAGGSEMQLALLARGLLQRGWGVRFVLGDHGQQPRGVTEDGIGIVTCSGRARFPRGLRFLLDRLPRLWQALREANADVYVCQGVGWPSGVTAAFCRWRGAKCVIRMGSIADPLFKDESVSFVPRKDRAFTAFGLKRAQVVTAQTREQLDLLRSHLGREGVLLPNVWPVPDRVVPRTDRPQVLWAGRIEGLKRPHAFLDAAEQSNGIRFVMAGGRGTHRGDCYEAIAQRAAGMANVTFRGFVPPSQMDAEYAAAWALVCTSEIEGFPNTFLQAWGHGRPVISTYDPDEVICRERIGVHCREVGELASVVRRICRDCDEAKEIGARGRAYVQAHHSPEAVIPQLERLLLDVIEGRPTQQR